MIREPTPHRAPAVLGRDEALKISDGALRMILMGVVVLIASGILALSLVPVARAAGAATMRFTDQFTGLSPGDLQFPRFPERSSILARDGTTIATLYLDENRKVVHLDEIAPIARQAVIAIEDDGFYDHGALDVEGILRAAFKNLKAGEVTEGGSTITQQLVKGVFTSGERTFARKLEEARLAFQLEQEYSKDEILELYLNEVYMGRSVNGIESAAEFYFAKSAKDLNLPEAATLAGLIAAPEAYNPVTEPEAAVARRNHVLDRMMALDYISEAEGEAAQAEPIVLDDRMRTTNRPGKAAYFVEYIRNAILTDPEFSRFGPPVKDGDCEHDETSELSSRCRALYQGGLRIHTTLDAKWLGYAKGAVRDQLPHPDDPQSAVVTIDSTNGAIRTLLGGTDFEAQKFDLATQGLRQPGSAAKAFTLVAALEQGIPASKVYDKASPTTIVDPACGAPWPVHNAEGGSAPGFINMAEATAASVNVYFAQLIRDAGPQSVVNAAEKMGVRSDLIPVCSMTLGGVEVTPLDMASAYATLANDGTHCEPFAVAKVLGPQGGEVYKHRAECKQVIDPQIVATVSSFLQGVVSHGTAASAIDLPRPVAGKTGTTNNHSDGWFVGYLHQQLSTSVWVGDIRGAIPIEGRGSIPGGLFGGGPPARIWNQYMARASESLPISSFPAPPPIPSAEVPDVVGLPEQEAVEVLSEANFTAEVKEKAAVGKPGIVVEQSPPGGSSVPGGSVVTIWVANGKTPKTAVPNVIGMTQDAAFDELSAAEFDVSVETVQVDSANQDGIVRDQDPVGGKKALVGSTVIIVVGRYVPPSPTPTSPSPSGNCTPGQTPQCDNGDKVAGPPRTGGLGGYAGLAVLAWVGVPVVLAAAARRRSLRPIRRR